MKRKQYAVIVRSSPYGSRLAKDALDMVLALSAFEQPLMLVFEGDGVMNLRAVNAAHKQISTYSNEWLALPIYDVNNIMVCAEDWQVYGDLSLPQKNSLATLNYRVLNRELIREELTHADIVLSF